MKLRRFLALLVATSFVCSMGGRAETVALKPVADAFLSEFNPGNNTGGHTNFAAGTVSNGTRTRALLRFDVAFGLPANVKVTGARLRITATRVNMSGGIGSSFDLRRVLVQWNEGSHTGPLGAQ